MMQQLNAIQHLHQHEWTIQTQLTCGSVLSTPKAHAAKKPKVLEQRVEWIYALDYGICMLFYHQDARKPWIIWRDQVEVGHWKYLKQVQQQLQQNKG